MLVLYAYVVICQHCHVLDLSLVSLVDSGSKTFLVQF